MEGVEQERLELDEDGVRVEQLAREVKQRLRTDGGFRSLARQTVDGSASAP